MKTASIHMTSYGCVYISSLNFLVKSLSTGKMWRVFGGSHRLHQYLCRESFEDLDTGCNKKYQAAADIVVGLEVIKPMHFSEFREFDATLDLELLLLIAFSNFEIKI